MTLLDNHKKFIDDIEEKSKSVLRAINLLHEKVVSARDK